MLKHVKGQKIRLEGFNNLTKSLSFNIYDICYARSHESQIEYLEYIDEAYNSDRLRDIIEEVTQIIDAKLLHMSTQDYEPRGASVTAMVSEEHGSPVPGMTNGSLTGHLDKSHIAAHSYPEHDPATGLASFRVDIDVSTCGMISPLHALHHLIGAFDSDIVVLDYRVRGFTRDSRGKKHFIDHDISSIQDYIAEDVLADYHAYDINIVSEKIFHTKMRKKRLSLSDYLFGPEAEGLKGKKRNDVKKLIENEIQEIFESQIL
ncbi:MAG TPA: adenosylmethionine decarboxylase [Spirochaetia bacterium]|nr:adenosylmethionine decarboxylase [Spirochaetia bacterium]